jgi:hypothetical protein
VKYVISWKPRAGGSAIENEASAARALEILKDFEPSERTTMHEYLLRIDGQGGFAVAESDNPADIAGTLFRLSPLNEYTVYPVIDSDEGLRIADVVAERFARGAG